MTICVAGICERGKSIVVVADQKLSATAYSADSMVLKVFGLRNNWGVMWASEKVTAVSSVLYAAAEACKSKAQYPDMVKAFRAALQGCLLENATARVLGPFGIDMKKFLAKGKMMFTEGEHADIVKKLLSECTESEFMVFGFDRRNQAHIFTVVDQDATIKTEGHTIVGFAAIGSGADMAQSSLFFHKYSKNYSLDLATYLLCEAKFMAESAEGVGEDTLCIVHRPQAKTFPLFPAHVQQIREFWQTYGKPKIPADAPVFVSAVLQQAEREVSELSAARAKKRQSENDSTAPSTSEQSESEP